MEASDLLKETPLFAEFSDADINSLAQSTRLEVYGPGDVIVREGRVGAALFVVISGNVEVIKGMTGADPEVVAKLGVGDFFGEIAVMKHVPRSASVRALSETKCLVIRRLDLESYIERYPNIASKVELALFTRFDKSQELRG